MIPKILNKDNKIYILVKEYPNHIMYKNKVSGVRECFLKRDLIESKEIIKPDREVNLTYHM